MNEVKTQQIAFFGTIKEKISTQTLLAKEIAKLLGVSTSEAYNKIAGNSLLTLPQIHLLCKTYNLNFLISPNGSYSSTLVEFLPFYQQNIDIDKYLFSINKFLCKINTAKDKKIMCAAEDIPILNLFKYPELSAFKLYYWHRRKQINNPNATVPDFTRKSINEEDVKAAYELYLLYKQIPGVEIWCGGSLANTVNQIKSAAESGVIKDKNLGKTIAKQLASVLSDIENYAINESKSEDASVPFEWYFCEDIGSVIYLAQLEKKQIAFIRFDTYNLLNTDSEILCNEVSHWMNALIYDGTSFSGQGSKHRNIYLKEAYQTCDELVAQFE